MYFLLILFLVIHMICRMYFIIIFNTYNKISISFKYKEIFILMEIIVAIVVFSVSQLELFLFFIFTAGLICVQFITK